MTDSGGDMNGKRTHGRRPSITATALWHASGGKRVSLFTDAESTQLALVSSVVRFKKGTHIYHEGDPADAVFNIMTGVVKSYKTLLDRTHHIVAFLFANDLIGLAEEGKYVNSAAAVTAVIGYKIPVAALKTKLGRESDLDFHIICKLCHELRETQRHGLMLSKHRAAVKVAMFLQMLESHQAARNESTEHVYLPMTRSDIGDYIGISPEAVSRSFKALKNRGVITFSDRRHVKIVGREQLASIGS
jgi:CRP-like cAMP-binding protein